MAAVTAVLLSGIRESVTVNTALVLLKDGLPATGDVRTMAIRAVQLFGRRLPGERVPDSRGRPGRRRTGPPAG
jgi:hypothetical protein